MSPSNSRRHCLNPVLNDRLTFYSHAKAGYSDGQARRFDPISRLIATKTALSPTHRTVHCGDVIPRVGHCTLDMRNRG
jgi:hypothetical protein